EQALGLVSELDAALAVICGKLPCRFSHHAAGALQAVGGVARQRRPLVALLRTQVLGLLGQIALGVPGLLQRVLRARVGLRALALLFASRPAESLVERAANTPEAAAELGVRIEAALGLIERAHRVLCAVGRLFQRQ